MSTEEQQQTLTTSTTEEIPNEQNKYEDSEQDEYEENEQNESEQDEQDEYEQDEYEQNEYEQNEYGQNEYGQNEYEDNEQSEYEDNEQSEYEGDEQNEHVEDEQTEHVDDEQQQREQYEGDYAQNQEEEVHQDLYQTVASSSTAESSNHTLRDENLVELPPVVPRPNKGGISAYARLSERYTFSFSADLISQFDKYRAHMRESIRQELEEEKVIEEEPENTEEIFSVHQVLHEPAGSVHSNSQNSRVSTKDRSTNNANLTTKSINKQSLLKKYFGISFLRRKSSKNNNDRSLTANTTTATTLSDLATLSSDIDQHQTNQLPTESTSTTNTAKKSKGYVSRFTHFFFSKK